MRITVRPNDSLWYYSQLFNIPLPLLLAANPHLSAVSLQIGQQINIPGYETASYTIQVHDSFWKISKQQQIPLDQLLLLNTASIADNLQPGQSIASPVRVQHAIVTDVTEYSYAKMQADIDKLIEVYPFIQKNVIGQTVLGKEIIELQFGTGARKKHINGAFHANEWITTPVIMQFANQYALALTNQQPINGLDMLPYFSQNTLSLVPMVNADGVDLVLFGAEAAGDKQESVLEINQGNQDFSDWKANINGVDLNNQFPALWEIDAARKPDSPQPRDFPDYAPLTEPESIAMAELAQQQPFDIMNAFHTQGQEFYWGIQRLEPAASYVIADEYERVSGYKSVQYVDSFSGYKDWFIQEFRHPGFTVELGLGVNPLPISQFDEIYADTLGIMLATLYM
ncbi:M14 family metallopeptidase [Gracilibacillus alcaliphilus]|uniref:M14 family metallopeptidase n=1 Tax=Gracilibacillus alcaliphilus TaxID=1401441 RepID=UPI00195B066B|nr:M14 family metallopeptidase [Gracilibacillus alcaliphilus]MBM7676346.1 g-D-glutamyl-meso-diaminopimelate peptidase [Gracilibacillus alcaliphilus]